MAEGQGATYTLDQAFSAIGIGKYQFYLLAFAGLGSIAEAMEMMLLTFIGLRIQSEMSLTPTQVNLISVATYVGLLLGSCLWGYVSDVYGRKKGIIGASIVAVIFGFVSIGTFSYIWLLFVRAIFGLGLGGGHIFYTWFKEFLPTPNQGNWIVFFWGFYSAGTILQALLVWLIIPNYSWRWLLGAAIAPHFVASCFIKSLPESPRFLCAQGRVRDAQATLEFVAIFNSKNLPEGTLVFDQKNSTAGTDQPVRTPGHVVDIRSPPITHDALGNSTITTPLLDKSAATSVPQDDIAKPSDNASSGQPSTGIAKPSDSGTNNHSSVNSQHSQSPTHSSDLNNDAFDDEHNEPPENSVSPQASVGSGSHSTTSMLSPSWRWITLLVWVLYFFNTFNYYEFVLLPSDSSPGSLLTLEDFKMSWPLLHVFITSLAEIPGLIIAAIMLNKFGCKLSIKILLGAGFIVIIPMMFFQSEVLTGILMFLWSSFVLVQIYSTEAFPTTLRTTGVLVATALGNTGGTVWPIISSKIRESGPTLPFLLYEAKLFVAAVCVCLLPD